MGQTRESGGAVLRALRDGRHRRGLGIYSQVAPTFHDEAVGLVASLVLPGRD